MVEDELLVSQVPLAAGLSYPVEGLQDLGERVAALGVEAVGEADPNVIVLLGELGLQVCCSDVHVVNDQVVLQGQDQDES